MASAPSASAPVTGRDIPIFSTFGWATPLPARPRTRPSASSRAIEDTTARSLIVKPPERAELRDGSRESEMAPAGAGREVHLPSRRDETTEIGADILWARGAGVNRGGAAAGR